MRPFVLLILDGYGFSKHTIGNAILNAKKPALDSIHQHYPLVLLQASGVAVGLPWGESGNSEAGHINIGAGRIVPQAMSIIRTAIDDKSFFDKEALRKAARHLAQTKGALHIVGLLTSGSVHAHVNHVYALIDFAQKRKITKVYLHFFTDGRDSAQKEAPQLLARVQEYAQERGVGKVVSVVGRSIAMTRDKNWDSTAQTYQLLTEGKGERVSELIPALQVKYERGFTDQTMPPLALAPGFVPIGDGDALIFFNFREDRMRKIARPFIDASFSAFPAKRFSDLYIATMTRYSDDFSAPSIFPRSDIKNSLAAVISQARIPQLHIAETEKYAHVTFFFNGLKEKAYQGEEDILIESNMPVIKHPEMRTTDIARRVADELDRGYFGFYVINFGNADMLSHLGDFKAAVRGVEVIDAAIAVIYKKVMEKNAQMIITADHGNAEALTYVGTGVQETKHNQNPVPCYFVIPELKRARGKTPEELHEEEHEARGMLADIAPSVLELMKLAVSEEMDGESLISLLSEPIG